MKNSLRYIVLAFVILGFLPNVCRADGVQLTLNTTDLTFTEGNSLLLNFTLTNGTGAAISVSAIGVGNDALVSGDISDNPLVLNPSLGACGAGMIQNTDSCGFSVSLSTERLPGEAFPETDNDSGVWTITFNALGSFGSASITTPDITVLDPVPAPEPASIYLLGTALMGVMAIGLRRKRSDSGSRRCAKTPSFVPL